MASKVGENTMNLQFKNVKEANAWLKDNGVNNYVLVNGQDEQLGFVYHLKYVSTDRETLTTLITHPDLNYCLSRFIEYVSEGKIGSFN